MHPDLHAPYVQTLIEANDWAALVRYWIAYQYNPALDAAINLLRKDLPGSEPHRLEVADLLDRFMADPFRRVGEVTGDLLSKFPEDQRLTISLLVCFQYAAMCPRIERVSASYQEDVLATGLDAADAGELLGRHFSAPAIAANFLSFAACGYTALGNQPVARAKYEKALDIYAAMTEDEKPRSVVTRAETMSDLGVLLQETGDDDGARRHFEEAVTLFRSLPASSDDASERSLMPVLINQGLLQCKVQDLPGALVTLSEAAGLLRALAVKLPHAYLQDLAGVLKRLGDVQSALHLSEPARASYRQALEAYAQLAIRKPGPWVHQAAVIHEKLGNLHWDASESEPAMDHHQLALNLFKGLAEGNPRDYRPLVARVMERLAELQWNAGKHSESVTTMREAIALLQNQAAVDPARYDQRLAHALTNQGQIEAAAGYPDNAVQAIEKALSIWRRLAKVNPTQYRPRLASALLSLGRLHWTAGRLPTAGANMEEAATLYRDLVRTDPTSLVSALTLTLDSLAEVQLARGHFDAAQEVLSEVLDVSNKDLSSQGDLRSTAIAARLMNLATAQRHGPKPLMAADSYARALSLFRTLESSSPDTYGLFVVGALIELSETLRGAGKLPEAAELYAEARDRLLRLTGPHLKERRLGLARVLDGMGGVHYQLNRRGDAIRYYSEALDVLAELVKEQPQTFRPVIAKTFAMRGAIYWEMGNLPEALRNMNAALNIFQELGAEDPEPYLPLIANTFNDVAIVERAMGRFESALADVHKALVIYRKLALAESALPRVKCAMALTNQGAILLDLSRAEPASESLTEAVRIWRKLSRSQSNVQREALAMALVNLGASERLRHRATPAKRLYEEALEIFRSRLRQKGTPERRRNVALTLLNLGAVHWDCKDSKNAVGCLQESLMRFRILAKDHAGDYRADLVRVLGNLAVVHSETRSIKKAKACFEEAVALQEGVGPSSFSINLIERRRLHVNFGLLLRRKESRMKLPNNAAAMDHLTRACRLTEQLRGMFRDPRERRRELIESLGLFELHARNCIDVWRQSTRKAKEGVRPLREAVWAAEASRARQLLDRFTEEEMQPLLAPPELQGKYKHLQSMITTVRLQAARMTQRIDSVVLTEGTESRGVERGMVANGALQEGTTTGPPESMEDLGQRLRVYEAEMVSLLAEIQRYDRGFDVRRSGEVLSCDVFETMVSSAPGTAFVEYLIGDDASIALVVLGRDRIRAVRLPRLSARQLRKTGEDWVEAHKRWQDRPPQGEDVGKTWDGHLQVLLDEIGEAAIAPVCSLLPKGIERVVVSPHRSLHLLPLHACRIDGSLPLAANWEFLYTPSLTLLHRCATRHRTSRTPSLLVENLPRTSGLQLPFAEAECHALRAKLPLIRSLTGNDATAEAILDAARQCDLLHYSGHASYVPTDPLSSRLVLSGAPLTLNHVFIGMRLEQSRLVVLSGCESGFLVPDVLDDYASFATGFLCAGAQCVVSTLWSIPDLPSALLMGRFYDLWLSGKPPATALRGAQLWLRQLRGTELEGAVRSLTDHLDDPELAQECYRASLEYTESLGEYPFSCPVHWAAYTCSGYGYANSGDPVAQGKTVV